MTGRRKMKMIVEQVTKEEREAQSNRLKKYYELLYKMKEMSFESQWNCYRECAKYDLLKIAHEQECEDSEEKVRY